MIIIVKFIKNKRIKIVIGFMLVTIIASLTTFICIARKNLIVIIDGKQIKLVTYQKTFDSALRKADIDVDLKDKIDKVLASKIADNDVITIKRAVNFKVLVDNKEPQHKIIAQGTLSHITLSRGSSSNNSSNIQNIKADTSSNKTFTVKATAYWATDGINNTYTFSGRKAVRNSNGYSTIAVDPNIIPMGTKLYVEGYGYAIAADKGSGVKGKFIDVYFNTREEASNWGIKYLEVKILD